jgi:LytS/YehU family sensor histidine kinase
MPLVLLTLTENTLTHGDIVSSANPATMTINVQDNQLKIRTGNAVISDHESQGQGLGLRNVQGRLEYYVWQ